MESTSLNNNSLAFIALCNEYCMAIENARESSHDEFIAEMLRLLPHIYISATDLRVTPITDEEDAYLENALEEDYYESVRRNIETLMGADDLYLEVFEEDMKYSDTPIAASISESLADLFQVLYNFVETIKNSPQTMIDVALVAIKDDFASYWSQILCNVLRPLNQLSHSIGDENEY